MNNNIIIIVWRYIYVYELCNYEITSSVDYFAYLSRDSCNLFSIGRTVVLIKQESVFKKMIFFLVVCCQILLIIPYTNAARDDNFALTIIHINDFHSRYIYYIHLCFAIITNKYFMQLKV